MPSSIKATVGDAGTLHWWLIELLLGCANATHNALVHVCYFRHLVYNPLHRRFRDNERLAWRYCGPRYGKQFCCRDCQVKAVG